MHHAAIRGLRSVAAVAVVAALAVAACGGDRGPAAPAIRFLHTFGPEETELFNAAMAERGIAVDPSLVPFARGQQVIGEILRAGVDCPDLIRIDATWLASFAGAGLLAPVPASLAGLDWTPEAAALAAPTGDDRATYAIPQAVDGLVVIRDESRPPPGAHPAATIEELAEAARATRTQTTRYPLGLRADGYWFVPWLRASGGELALPAGGEVAADARALAKFAALYGDVVPPPPPAGGEAPHELRRWLAHDIAYWVTGPWQIGALAERERLAVSALAHAPRGGQLLVVPTCARRPDEGWRLAAELVDRAVAGTFADAFTTVPSRRSTLEASGPLVRAIYAALVAAEPLPRVAATPFLFDDLNPAIASVIAGDATADEAMAGVRRGWLRLASTLGGKK
ncbi:MAG: extracellular solute-binding protein [Deltaproteobacteria bacterium]|nr:extracellular solute-binding protein [Deltaproteobacteria bacterium]